MNKRDVKRDYESADIIVHWDSSKCIHCGNCVRGLPEVFNLQNHPWIAVDALPPDDVLVKVVQCPSGALSATDKRLLS